MHRRRGLGDDDAETADRRQQRGQRARDRGLSVGAQNQTRQRDADLAGGDVAVEGDRGADQGKQPGGEGVAVGGQLLNPAPPHADGGELGGHIDGVDQDQGNEDEDHQHGVTRL